LLNAPGEPRQELGAFQDMQDADSQLSADSPHVTTVAVPAMRRLRTRTISNPHDYKQPTSASTSPPKKRLHRKTSLVREPHLAALVGTGTCGASIWQGRETANSQDLASLADLLGADPQEVGGLADLMPCMNANAGDLFSSLSPAMSLVELGDREDLSTERSTLQAPLEELLESSSGADLLESSPSHRLAFHLPPLPSSESSASAMQAFTASFRRSHMRSSPESAVPQMSADNPNRVPCERPQLLAPPPLYITNMPGGTFLKHNRSNSSQGHLLPGHLPLRFGSDMASCPVTLTALPGYPEFVLPLRAARLCSGGCRDAWRRISGEVLALKMQILAALAVHGAHSRHCMDPALLLTLPRLDHSLSVRTLFDCLYRSSTAAILTCHVQMSRRNFTEVIWRPTEMQYSPNKSSNLMM
jgi:hypothetical protein